MKHLLSILAFVLLLAACGEPPQPAPPPTPTKPLICCVPGLGESQLADVVKMCREKFPQADVIDFATADKNNYRTNLAEYLRKYGANRKVVLAGHSYGTDKIDQVWAGAGPVELAVLLDPVPEELFGHYTVPANVKKVVVVTGDFVGLIRAKIYGPYTEYKVHAGHSPMAHDPATLALVESHVREALPTP